MGDDAHNSHLRFAPLTIKIWICNMTKISHSEYREKLRRHNPNIKLLSEFESLRQKVMVMDDLGIVYSIVAKSALESKHPSITSAIDKTKAFNLKIEKSHPGLKLNEKYTTGCSKTEFIDSHGVIYVIKPESLLAGNKPCIRSAKDKNYCFVRNARLVHGDRYDYSKSEYTGDKTKIEIICKDHGSFFQKPNTHIKQRSGCPDCNKTRGWHKSKWLEFSDGKTCTFYIIKCYSNDEEFIKIGITTRSIKSRFQSKKEMSYKYDVIKSVPCSNLEAWNAEKSMLKMHNKYAYKPIVDFKGSNESFNTKILKFIS